MSIKALSWVWEHSRARGADLLVLLAIADYAHDDGTQATPSRKALAAKARISVRGVDRHVAHLCSIGELGVRRRPRPEAPSQWTSSEYVLVGLQRQSVATPQGQTDATRCQSVARGSATGDTGVVSTVAHHKESEPSVEPTTGTTRSSRRRDRDPVYDALARVQGLDLTRPIPRAMGSSLAAAKRDLLEVEPTVTATEVMRRAGRYRRAWPKTSLTAHALVKHWHTFAADEDALSDHRQPVNMRQTTDPGG